MGIGKINQTVYPMKITRHLRIVVHSRWPEYYITLLPLAEQLIGVIPRTLLSQLQLYYICVYSDTSGDLFDRRQCCCIIIFQLCPSYYVNVWLWLSDSQIYHENLTVSFISIGKSLIFIVFLVYLKKKNSNQ